VRDNQTGLVTKANTPDALAATIYEFLANPAKAERLREAGWKWSQELTWEQTALVALQHIGGNSNQALAHLETALVEVGAE
jgi:glycosyltransferase involved in cell wall biosynthesis